MATEMKLCSKNIDGLNTHSALEMLSSAGSQEHFTWKRFAEMGWWRFQLYILARSLKYIKVHRTAQREQRAVVLDVRPKQSYEDSLYTL